MSDDRDTTGQVEVMLLGTYHMANPGHDLINVDADSPLDPTRQAELETCTDRLADWEPDRIAVEYPHDKQIPLNDLYDRCNEGSLKLDGSTPLPDPFADGFIENEVIQLGIRLAIRCGHTHVLAIDHEAHTPAWTDDGAIATMLTRLPAPDDVPYHLPDPTETQETQQSNLEEYPIGAFIAWFDILPAVNDGDSFVGQQGQSYVPESTLTKPRGFSCGSWAMRRACMEA